MAGVTANKRQGLSLMSLSCLVTHSVYVECYDLLFILVYSKLKCLFRNVFLEALDVYPVYDGIWSAVWFRRWCICRYFGHFRFKPRLCDVTWWQWRHGEWHLRLPRLSGSQLSFPSSCRDTMYLQHGDSGTKPSAGVQSHRACSPVVLTHSSYLAVSITSRFRKRDTVC